MANLALIEFPAKLNDELVMVEIRRGGIHWSPSSGDRYDPGEVLVEDVIAALVLEAQSALAVLRIVHAGPTLDFLASSANVIASQRMIGRFLSE